MSITSNAKTKLVNNSDELLKLLQGMGVSVDKLQGVTPAYKAISDHDKLCQKRWQQRNPDKLRVYIQRFMATDKGQALRERNAEKERTPEKRARRKAYRDSPEIKERIRAYAADYYVEKREQIAERNKAFYIENKDRINAQYREYYESNKERIQQKHQENRAANKELINERRRAYYAANREKIAEHKRAYNARRRELYRQKRSILLDCRGKDNPLTQQN